MSAAGFAVFAEFSTPNIGNCQGVTVCRRCVNQTPQRPQTPHSKGHGVQTSLRGRRGAEVFDGDLFAAPCIALARSMTAEDVCGWIANLNTENQKCRTLDRNHAHILAVLSSSMVAQVDARSTAPGRAHSQTLREVAGTTAATGACGTESEKTSFGGTMACANPASPLVESHPPNMLITLFRKRMAAPTPQTTCKQSARNATRPRRSPRDALVGVPKSRRPFGPGPFSPSNFPAGQFLNRGGVSIR